MTIHLELGQVCLGGRRPVCRRIPLNMNARLHWSTRAKWNKAWYQEVWGRYVNAKYPLPAPRLERPQVTITFHRIVAGDYDGLWQSAKPIIDAIVQLGLVEDDSPKHLPPPIVRHQLAAHRGDERVEILVEAG
jgi:hypothetical protein